MLSFASAHLRNLYISTLDYLQARPSPASSLTDTPEHAAAEFSNLRDLTSDAHAVSLSLSPTSPRLGRNPLFMRRELEFTKTALTRTKNDVSMLEDRCKILEKTLNDTRGILRAREAEVEKVRKERDRERKLSERKRSDSIPRHSSGTHKLDLAHPRHLPTEMKSLPGASLHPNGRPSTSAKRSASAAAAKAGPLPTPPTTSSSSRTQSTSPLSAAEERARQKSSEAYLTRTDSWSGAQVLQALQDINSEIFQFAASATEVCTFSTGAFAPRPGQATQDASGRLGPRFARILAGRDHSQDPLLVQWALQGCVAMCIARALNAFCFGFPAEADNILSQIYRRMALAEPQPTSSKWRALTHRNIHAVYPTLDDYAVQKLTDTVVRWSADVFFISGCSSFNDPSLSPTSISTSPPMAALSVSAPSSYPHLSNQPSYSSLNSRNSFASSHASITSSHLSTTTSANPGIAHIREALRSHFGDQIRRLARSATKLATTLREEILSTSFDIIVVDYTQAFDSNMMHDIMREHAHTAPSNSPSNGSNGTSAATSVLATTDLGLLCTTRIGNRESVGDEDVTIEKRLILKPKVVLESVLEMLDR